MSEQISYVSTIAQLKEKIIDFSGPETQFGTDSEYSSRNSTGKTREVKTFSVITTILHGSIR